MNHVSQWVLAIKRKCKATFLSTSHKIPDSPNIIFKASSYYSTILFYKTILFVSNIYMCVKSCLDLHKRYRCHHNTRPRINSIPILKHFECKGTRIMQIENEYSDGISKLFYRKNNYIFLSLFKIK